MLTVAVIDVGSPKQGRLGWAIRRPAEPLQSGRNLDEFLVRVAAALSDGAVALGFEAPLFIPVHPSLSHPSTG